MDATKWFTHLLVILFFNLGITTYLKNLFLVYYYNNITYPTKIGVTCFMFTHSYPTRFITHWQLSGGTDVTIRPIRAQDAEIEKEFVRNLSEESRYFRFMYSLRELTPEMLVRFTQIDYQHEMALIAVIKQKNQEVEIGVARYSMDADEKSCEFAIAIADEWQHYGIGRKLMTCLMDIARKAKLKMMRGTVLANNHNMLHLMVKLGFSIILDEEDHSMTIVEKIL